MQSNAPSNQVAAAVRYDDDYPLLYDQPAARPAEAAISLETITPHTHSDESASPCPSGRCRSCGRCRR